MTAANVGANARDFHFGINMEGYMETAKGSVILLHSKFQILIRYIPFQNLNIWFYGNFRILAPIMEHNGAT